MLATLLIERRKKDIADEQLAAYYRLMEVPEAVHLRYMDATLRFRQKDASLLADGKRGISSCRPRIGQCRSSYGVVSMPR